MNGEVITFRATEELKARAEAKCKREDITLSQVLRRCLREWVMQDDQKEQDSE